MNISPIAVRASSAEFSSARSDRIKSYKDIVATAGQQVKADEILLSPKAIKLLQTKPTDMKSIGMAQNDPPVLWAPKDLPIFSATGVKIEGPVKELNDDVKSVGNIKGVKIDGDVKEIGDAVVHTDPPRSRAEAWRAGWSNLGKTYDRLTELAKKAQDPSLSNTDRAALNQEFQQNLAALDQFADSLVQEQGLTGQQAQIWRNSVGSREIRMNQGQSIATAEGAKNVAETLESRRYVVTMTMRYLGVA